MNPASHEARNAGCCCDEVVNNNGNGTGRTDLYGMDFVIKEACIIHGASSWIHPEVEHQTGRLFETVDSPHVFIPINVSIVHQNSDIYNLIGITDMSRQ